MPAIVSYQVGVTRSQKTGAVRWLTLKFESGHGHENPRSASLHFFEKGGPELGFLNRETGTVVVNLPIVDFDPTYRILNTEKPVYFYFRIQGVDHHLVSFDLSTSQEPVGEGAVDTSP
jgi:hypothetical protein